MDLFLQQLVNGLAVGATYSLFAVGFSLVFASMGILNLAHGTFASWGAIVALLVVTSLDIPFWLALVVGVVAAGLIGVIVDQFGFQPLRGRDSGSLGLIITSIGFWLILLELGLMVNGPNALSFPDSQLKTSRFSLAGISVSGPQMLSIVALIVVGLAMWLFMTRTRFGSAIRAVGYDRTASMLGGIEPRKIIIVTAFLAAGIAGLAGVLSGLATNNVSSQLGEGMLLKGFAAVVVGGFGDIRGAIVGGLLIGVFEVLGAEYISSGLRDAVTFGLLFLFLIVRPSGIFGEVRHERA
ncbi:branched-chain amino acid ABC transporter permease [Microbacterium alcoholitolerans]|uniref:branched-chain amino acid ABC transporter permease n=1 Tax=unclassified Microbacterium TaxID=2609290 RepID=UPI003D16BDC0